MRKVLALVVAVFFIGSGVAFAVPPNPITIINNNYTTVNNYLEDDRESLDYGVEAELVVYKNDEKLLNEGRVDVSHVFESNETRIMLVGQVALYKLWK